MDLLLWHLNKTVEQIRTELCTQENPNRRIFLQRKLYNKLRQIEDVKANVPGAEHPKDYAAQCS